MFRDGWEGASRRVVHGVVAFKCQGSSSCLQVCLWLFGTPLHVPRCSTTSQIPCQGRGQVPQPEAVTDLVFEMYQVGGSLGGGVSCCAPVDDGLLGTLMGLFAAAGQPHGCKHTPCYPITTCRAPKCLPALLLRSHPGRSTCKNAPPAWR